MPSLTAIYLGTFDPRKPERSCVRSSRSRLGPLPRPGRVLPAQQPHPGARHSWPISSLSLLAAQRVVSDALLSPWFERGEDKTLPSARQFSVCTCSLNFSQGKRVVQRLRELFNLPGMTLCHRTQGDWADGRSKHREAFTWEKSPHARVSSLLRVETSCSRSRYQAVPGCLPGLPD